MQNTFTIDATCDIVIDNGEYWNSIPTVYGYSMGSNDWFANLTPTSRYMRISGYIGQCRYGIASTVNNERNASSIEVWIVRNDKPFTSMEIKNTFNWRSKSAIFFGDSIMYGHTSSGQATHNVPAAFKEATGLSTALNKAISGSTYTSISGLANIKDTIQTVAEDTGIDYNYLFIAGGINDWARNQKLPDFRAAVKATYDYIYSVPHHAKVIVISPINFAHGKNYPTNDCSKHDIREFREIIKEEALNHGFTYIDGADIGFPSSLNALTDDNSLYSGDGLHCTDAGYRFYGYRLAEILSKHFNATYDCYRTVPMFTGKFWINGEPIYRKVIDVGDVDTTSGTDFQIDATLTQSYCQVINYYGYAYDNVGTNCFMQPYNNGTTYFNTMYQASGNGGLHIQSNSKWKSMKYVVEFFLK